MAATRKTTRWTREGLPGMARRDMVMYSPSRWIARIPPRIDRSRQRNIRIKKEDEHRKYETVFALWQTGVLEELFRLGLA